MGNPTHFEPEQPTPTLTDFSQSQPIQTSSNQIQSDSSSFNQTHSTLMSFPNWKLKDLHLHRLQLLVFGANAQDALQKLLSHFAVSSKLVTHYNPSLAIHQIFQQCLPQLQNICNLSKNPTTRSLLCHDVPTQTFYNQIDIKKMDTTLLVDILNKLDAFPTASQRNNTLVCMYAVGSHQNKCCVACAHICSHCLRGKCRNTCCLTNKKCEHACCGCQFTKWQCKSYKSVCCDSCNMCIYCLMSTNNVNTWIELIQKLASKSIKICDISELRIAIEIIAIYHNLIKHLTKEQCNEMDNGNFHNERLPGLNKWSLIHPIISHAIKLISKYLYAKQFISKYQFDACLYGLEELLKFKNNSDLLDANKDLIVAFLRPEQLTEIISSFPNLTAAVQGAQDPHHWSNLQWLKFILRFKFPYPVKFDIYGDFVDRVEPIFRKAVQQCLKVEERPDTYKAILNGSVTDTMASDYNASFIYIKFTIKPKSRGFSLDDYENKNSQESLRLWTQIETLVEQKIKVGRLPQFAITCTFWDVESRSIIIHTSISKSNGKTWEEHEVEEFITPKMPHLSEEIEKAYEDLYCSCSILKRKIVPDNVVDLEFEVCSSLTKTNQVKETFRQLLEEARGNNHFMDFDFVTDSKFETEDCEGEKDSDGFTKETDENLRTNLTTDFRTWFKILRGASPEENDMVLEDVLAIVCNHIGKDWLKLAEILELEEIEEDSSIHHEENMRNIVWSKLKDALTMLGRDDIVNVVLENSYVTKGRRNANYKLREKHVNELKHLQMDSIFEDHTFIDERLKAILDLSIIEVEESDQMLNISDRECHKLKNISMEEIWDGKDNFVITRGIAGIGKSELVKTLILKWAYGELWNGERMENKMEKNGERESVRFLFSFDGRDLNNTDLKSFESVESLLRKKYGDIFQFITMNDLIEVSDNVLIIIDGLDELRDISNINKSEKPKHLQCLTDLINPFCEELSNHKTIVVGRPEACHTIHSLVYSVEQKISCKMVEIIGFNEASIKDFIGKVFKGVEARVDRVTEIILNTEQFRKLAHIPIFLWVLCHLFNERIEMQNSQNLSQLYTYSMLFFIKNHLRLKGSHKIKHGSLKELCKDQEICDKVLFLAHIAMVTYQEGKVGFTMEDIKGINISTIDVEAVGFIVKNGHLYQFLHFFIQEYMAALYITVTGEYCKLKTDETLSHCLPFVAGLCGFERRKNCEIDHLIVDFIKNLREIYKNKSSIFAKLFKSTQSTFQAILEDELKKKMLQSKKNEILFLNESCSNIMAAVHEYSCEPSEDFRKNFKSQTIIVSNSTNICYHYIKILASLLHYLEIGSIGGIDITNFGNNKIPLNILTLFQLYFQDKERNKRCCELRTDDEMSITTQGYQRIENCVIVNFARGSNNQEQYQKLLISLISMVNTIYVDYSLDILYLKIKELLHQYQEENNGDAPTLKLPKPLIRFSKLSNPTPSQVEIFSDLVVSECSKLKQTITVSLNQKLNGDHIQKLTSCAPYIEELDLSGNSEITTGALIAFRQVVQKRDLPALSKLRLDGRTLTSDHFKEIAAIIQATSIEILSLDCCTGLTPDLMQILNEAVVKRYSQSGTILMSLSLRKCKLTDEIFEKLLQAFQFIKSVDMSQNSSLSEKVLDLLMEHVSELESCLLEVLNLSQTSITKCNHDAFKEIFAIRFDQQIHIII